MALPKTPPTEISNVSEARRQFSETLDRVRRHEARVVVEKSGIPVGAIVSMEDLASLRHIDDEREESRRRLKLILENVRKDFEGMSDDEVDRQMELIRAKISRDADDDLLEIMTQTSRGFDGIPEEELLREVAKADATVKARRISARHGESGSTS
jgi:prevent-host-death family protein